MPPVGDRLTNKAESIVDSEALIAERNTTTRIVRDFFEQGLIDGGQSQVAIYSATNRGDSIEIKAWLSARNIDARNVELSLWTDNDTYVNSLQRHLTINVSLGEDGKIGDLYTLLSYDQELRTEELRIDAMKNVNETLDFILAAHS